MMLLNPNPSESQHCDTESPDFRLLDCWILSGFSLPPLGHAHRIHLSAMDSVMCDAVISAAGHFATFSLIFNSQKQFK